MLWVGGHIRLVDVDDLGWRRLYDLVHDAEESGKDAVCTGGAALAWLLNTCVSAVIGAVAVAMWHLVQKRRSPAGHLPRFVWAVGPCQRCGEPT